MSRKKKQYRLGAPDLVWSWNEKEATQAILTVLEQVVFKKLTMKSAKNLLLMAGLIEEVKK